MRCWPTIVLLLALLLAPAASVAHDPAQHRAATEAPPEMRLPVIGPAPDFDLTSQDGSRVTLADFRGKVVAVAFIFTTCPDICPMLTANMGRVQEKLGADFGEKVAFVSITVDPEQDTPQVLKAYAEMFGADLTGWAFLTGDPQAIQNVARAYGVFAAKAIDGGVDHTLLTSIVDPQGVLRVQYIGSRFDLEEFRSDLLSLVGEAE
jgi:protein SCO1/2